MRFTPSTNWNIASSAAYRRVMWTNSIRKTASLSDALFTGTWINIDPYIVSIDDPSQRIEGEVGQFSSGSITITVRDIAWWDANIFNYANYLEFRRTPSIGIGDSMMSTDEVCVFTGFIDRTITPPTYDDDNDEITFTVFTQDELGNRTPAMAINTQYINTDIDAAGTDGLILPKISGVYVQDANIASFVLKKGLHTLEFDYNEGTEQMRLDDGEWIPLPTSDGTVDLINGDANQKIKLFVDVSELQGSTTTDTIKEEIIVQTAGDTLPRCHL